MDLNGKTALVTAGHVRIGHAISLALAGRGCNVAIQYNRSEAPALTTVVQLNEMGVRSVAIQTELSSTEQVAALARRATEELGEIDVLVNNASTFYRTPLEQIREVDWDTMHDVNLKAPFLLCSHLGPRMRERGAGKIVNIADWAGERPYRHYLPYCVSKAGLIALTKALAKELAPTVQVNTICPGPILWANGMSEEDQAAVLDKTPLARHGDPEDIARAVLFLVEGTDFATGATLHIDGGRSIH